MKLSRRKIFLSLSWFYLPPIPVNKLPYFVCTLIFFIYVYFTRARAYYLPLYLVFSFTSFTTFINYLK